MTERRNYVKYSFIKVDPAWPKPLPERWLVGAIAGVAVDARDHVWIVHRPGTLQPNESRLYAHTIADELHKEQRGLNGIARTKIAFSSDRDGERIRGPSSSGTRTAADRWATAASRTFTCRTTMARGSSA